MNVKPFVGQEVMVQLKHALLLIAYHENRFHPLRMCDIDPQNQAGNMTPVPVERLEGKLIEEGDGGFVLLYQNPTQPGSQMKMGLDPENVAAIWSSPRIQVVGGGGIIAP